MQLLFVNLTYISLIGSSLRLSTHVYNVTFVKEKTKNDEDLYITIIQFVQRKTYNSCKERQKF